mmetsp:Transcript_342/g.483  ORF Transcript_342/g.483 Transcript_342/m.483 type:complete len:400 (+) Transcript_342:101-1300(+)
MASTEENNDLEEEPEKRVTGPLPLDWTRVQRQQEEEGHPVRFPWEVTDIDNNEEEIVIVGTAGQKITKMGTNLGDHCNPKLKQLVFRSHLIRTMEGIGTFEELVLLELYDNMIEKLYALDDGCNGAPGFTLKTLDMSYNVIRDMEPVSSCPNLRELYLANNKLKSMAGLKNLKHLIKIDLGANKIRVIEPEELHGLENLEELWLGKNKIEKIQGLTNLTKLRRLDVQSNRLKSVENLTSQMQTLEELYLAHNGINDEGASQPTGLALKFARLSVVDLSRNFLTTTEPFSHLLSLDELWLSGNKIDSFDHISPLSTLPALDTVYLEYNPVASDFEYRKKVKALIPSLNQIDADLIAGLNANGFHSTGGGVVETHEAQMRRLQEIALTKARAESELKKVEP